MKTIINNRTEPAFNLALEEYLLKEYDFDEDILLVWQNDKCVILGRNQNPWNEINLSYTEKNNIPVLRRISGGGTVVHDLGNINFSFITKNTSKVNDYKSFLSPIILVLQSIGVNATFKPKSHIYVDDKKISGNAQALHKSKMIHHGTLLFDADLSFVSKCIKKNPFIKGHFVESDRANITNIKDYIKVQASTSEFMNYLRNEILLNDETNKTIQLSETDINRINEIRLNKYQTYDWNFGKSFELKHNTHTFTIKNGIVIDSTQKELVGKKFLPSNIEKTLGAALVNEIF